MNASPSITHTNKLPGKQPQILSLIVLSAFASMGSILMTPALPSIMQYFHVSKGAAQLTVTLFLVGYGCGQLIYGPLANRYGRRHAFFIGIALASLGSIFSILSSPTDSFTLLLVGRLLEALGSSAGLVVSFTIISDFFSDTKARKIMAYLMLAFAIVPAVGVFLGGVIVEFLHWQSCFYFLLIYGFFLLIPAYYLPETLLEKNLNAMKVKGILQSYTQLFKNPNLLRYSMIFGLSTCLAYLFSADGPFIGISRIGLTPFTYGLWGMIPSVGMLIGALLSARISHRHSSNAMIVSGQCIQMMAGIAMLTLFITGIINLTTLLVPMLFTFLGHGFISSNSSTPALASVQDKANGSAVMSFIMMLIPVFATLILSEVNIHSPAILPSLMVAAIALSLIVSAFQILKVHNKQR